MSDGRDIEAITAMGKEATAFVEGLGHPGDVVRLEFDVRPRDRYGRPPAQRWRDEEI
jgi:endonuclease YncB( thermonuclease family)